MSISLDTNGFSLVSKINSSGIASQLGRNLAREVAMSGYGELGKQDVGWAVTRTVDAVRTVQSFAALPMMADAKHSSFEIFRQAMAESAQMQTNDLLQQVNAGNMSRAELDKVISGEAYTGFYADAVSGQHAVGDLLANVEGSPEALLNFSNVDFNNSQSVTEYLDRIREYAGTINLRNDVNMSATSMQSEEYGLLILMHTENSEAYGQYIEQFETQIQNNFQRELETMQQNVKAMGYAGNLNDIDALEIFKNTQSGANASQVQQLIDATNGKINQVDRYILARIHNGDIDIHKILATGEFNGVKLDDKALAAFKALNVYANSDQIVNNFHNEILERIGFKSSMKNVDLNNLKHVDGRIKEFEEALTKAGYGSINGKTISKLSIKEIREIDLSAIKDENVLAAMKQYISLRDHKETLTQAKNMMANFRMRMVNLFRKALGDSDLSQAIGQIQSGVHNAQLALKVWNRYGAPVAKKLFKFFNKTTIKLIKHMPPSVQHAYFKNLRFMRSIVGKAKELWGRVTSAPRRAAQKAATKAMQSASNKVTRKAAQEVAKHATRVAKHTERKLIMKAGQKAIDLVRHASHLISSGAIGTTGAGAVGVTATTTAATTTVAAATTTTVAAAGATTTTVAAGAVGTGATIGTGGVAAIAMAAVIVVLIYIVLIAMAAYAVGACMEGIGNSALEFEDTLLGKIINFFAKFKWPWEDKYPTEEEKQNVLHYTLTQLLVEQENWHDLTNHQSFMGGSRPQDGSGKTVTHVEQCTNIAGAIAFKGGVIRPDGTVSSDMSLLTKNGNLVYRFVGTDGYGHTYPINEYSTTKLAIAMAHAFTYPIEKQEHLANFSLYATGLWRYLNQVELKCKLTFCTNANWHKNGNGTRRDGCGYFTYRCDTYGKSDSTNPHRVSILYDKIDAGMVKVLTKEEIKNGISLTANTPSYLYVTSGPIVKERIPGVDYSCLYAIYHPNGSTVKGTAYGHKDVYDRNTSGRYSESGYIPITYFENIDSSKIYNWDKYGNDEIPQSPYMKDKNGKSFKYTLMPNICDICLSKIDYEYGSEQGLRNNTTICSLEDVLNGKCNNITRKQTSTAITLMPCPTTPIKFTNSNGNTKEFKIITSHNTAWIPSSEMQSYRDGIKEELKGLINDIKVDIPGIKHDEISEHQLSELSDEVRNKYSRLKHIHDEHQILTKYVCQGHDETAYCDNLTHTSLKIVYKYSTYTDAFGVRCVSPKTQNINHYSTTRCCDNCIEIPGMPYSDWEFCSGGGVATYTSIIKYWKTYYICQGGESTHGEFTDDATKGICDNYVEVSAETCNGGYNKAKTNYETVCQGHVKCVNSSTCTIFTDNNNEHVIACPGHTLYYCSGEPEYIFTQKIMDETSEAIFSNDWKYTTTGQFLWIEKTYTYSPMGGNIGGVNTTKLARDDWAGWNENNREMMMGVLSDDWYAKYGYGISSFIGAEISPSERIAYKKAFNITDQNTPSHLMANLEFAFDSIGKVAYYPGDQALYPKYDERNKFYTAAPDVFIDEGVNQGYVLNTHGLDYKYYADWVYRSTHENKSNSLLTTDYHSCGTRVVGGIPAGTPIVCTQSKNIKTGILIGVRGTTVTYIGLSDAGWVTIIDSTSAWYTADSLKRE